MLTFSRWKQIAILVTCLVGLLVVLPNFFSRSTLDRWPRWVPAKQLNLGLDLRGGAHLLLAMEVNDVRKDWLDGLRDDARRRLREAKIGISAVGIAGNAVQVRIAKAEESEAALKALKQMIQPLGNPIFGTSGADIDVAQGEPRQHHHHADRGRAEAAHRQCHLGRHRDRAAARRRHGHHRAQYRARGHQPHSRSGAGPVRYRPAQGADRQDRAPELP